MKRDDLLRDFKIEFNFSLKKYTVELSSKKP